MITALINIAIYLVILVIIYYLIDYILKAVPVPDPPARILRILMVVIFCLILIALLLNMLGVGFGPLPRLVN